MPRLLIVGGGLFGSQAAALARLNGIEALVFDAGLPGAASPAAAGLFKEAWVGRKFREHFERALPVLDRLYGLRRVHLTNCDGSQESFHFVPPSAILETKPIRATVTAVGDGWLEADEVRYEGNVYIAAGVWNARFQPGLGVYGKAGASFLFAGECEGQIRPIAHGRQAIAFVRDAGTTFFSDGTAERQYEAAHDRQTLDHAATVGLVEPPIKRMWGWRPYVPGGPVFMRLGQHTWLATGGRKMGTILGASFARRLVEEELSPARK
jgi:hypothetical protein